jgi:hypothetical protein
MSPSDDSTRPISVAELLARNGTIGAPPVSGRRRRRRGNDQSVTVAELTGEIPVIRATEIPVAVPEATDESVAASEATDESVAASEATDESAAEEPIYEEPIYEEPAADELVYEEPVVDELVYEEPASAETVVVYGDGVYADTVYTDDSVYADTVYTDDSVHTDTVYTDDSVHTDTVHADDSIYTDYTDYTEPAPVPESPPLSSAPLPSRERGLERSHDPRPRRRSSGAEQMTYDPVDQSVDLAGLVDDQADVAEELRSYLRSSSGTLFSGETVADDLARRGVTEVGDDLPGAGLVTTAAARSREAPLTALRHGLVAVAQSVLAVVFGAGLFLGFDQLWRWNNIVALVLSVLVILGLVVAVRAVRKTEDIASTLIAVAVGALVTLGPLALLQST